MTNNADLRNNTTSAAMRASIGQHLATTTVLDHATAWRVAGDILVMCPQLLESPGMRGHLTEDEKNEQSSLANWDAMLYGQSFMVDGVRIDPRRVVVGMSAAAPQVVADERTAFIEHQRRADSIPEFIEDDVIMAGEITNHQWAGWQARAALAAAPVQPVAVPDLISAIVIGVLEAARDFIGANAVPADAKGASESAHQARKMAALIDSVLAHLPAAPAAQVDAKAAS